MLPSGISGTQDRGVEKRYYGVGFSQSAMLTASPVWQLSPRRNNCCKHSAQLPSPSSQVHPHMALSTWSWVSLSISHHCECSGMWSIPCRKLHRQQHCLWMLTLAQGQATPGTIIVILRPVQDLMPLEPFQVWEVMRSWKTLLGALACRNVARWFCHQSLSTLYSIWWEWTKWKLRFTETDNNMHIQHAGYSM